MAKKEVKGWDKVVAWYARHAYGVNMVYSLGASIVIIGALFKILHWPGANYVLMLGMFTEAFLFGIGIFEKPHAVYNWENVFPQLLGHDADPLNGTDKPEEKKSATAPALEEKDVKALKESIANVAASANHLADLGKLAEGTNKLSEKLVAAASAADKFAGAEEGLVEGTQKAAHAAQKLGDSYAASAAAVQEAAKENEAIAKATSDAAQNANGMAKQLGALNAAYELQVKAAQAIQKDADSFAAAQQKLNQQIADLNKIYGNMLSALA